MKRRLAPLAIVVTLASALGGIAPSRTSASPIDDKQAQAARLQQEIDANGEQISVLAEQYNGARLHLEDAQQELRRVEADRAAAERTTNGLRARVADRGAALYMGAGTQTPLSWASVSNVNEAGSRATYAAVATDRDGHLLDQLRAAREDLGLAQARLEQARDAAQRELDSLDARRAEVERANARQTELLAQVKGELATLIEQERARRAAAERQRSEAEFARLHLDAIARQRASIDSTPTSDSAPTEGVDPAQVPVPDAPAPSAGAAAAVAYANAQLGKPYRYAAAGPDEFDCSGLTMMAWAQAGVSMPHYSAAQGAMFPRVPNDQLSPGDLVIYYPDQHHVAIYVGGAMTVAATQTGDFVKLQPVFRSGYQYAVRPS